LHSIKPHTEFEAEVYVLAKEEGGRYTPFLSGYTAQFFFRTTDPPAPSRFSATPASQETVCFAWKVSKGFQQLDLGGTDLKDEDVRQLAEMTARMALDLSNTAITDQGLTHSDRGVTDDGWIRDRDRWCSARRVDPGFLKNRRARLRYRCAPCYKFALFTWHAFLPPS
jgi:hypothetical protein